VVRYSQAKAEATKDKRRIKKAADIVSGLVPSSTLHIILFKAVVSQLFPT
jgi:hypothetical protein